MPIPGYEEYHFPSGEWAKAVCKRGSGPGVVILQELPGLSQETVEFADVVADAGFSVHLPLLYGRPFHSPPFGLLSLPWWCNRREFDCLKAGRSSPISDWLRALCRSIHGEAGDPGVGAIGMCFSGGFVFSMMLEPAVLAPVTAQPTLPFLSDGALDVEPETLAAAAIRADVAPLLGLRFEEDQLCPAARFERINEAFCGSPVENCARFEQVIVCGKGHSTLTSDYPRALRVGVDTRNRVIRHLRRQLM